MTATPAPHHKEDHMPMTATAPLAMLHQGEDAVTKFDLLFARAFDDDAVGGVSAYSTAVGGPRIQSLRLEDAQRVHAGDFDLVIIDSGNRDGDLWKYIYHVAEKVGTFIVETEA